MYGVRRSRFLSRVSFPRHNFRGTVEIVEKFAGIDDPFLRRIFKVGLEDQLHAITNRHHASDACRRRSRNSSGFEAIATADDDFAIPQSESCILDAGECGFIIESRRRAARFVSRNVGARWQGLNGSAKPFGRQVPFECRFPTAIHGPSERHRPEHHFRVPDIVFIDRNGPVGAIDILESEPSVARGL
jgi:hypothetical protein